MKRLARTRKKPLKRILICCSTKALPTPARLSPEEHRRNPDYADFTWGLVATRNIPALNKAVRINISLPEALVQKIDAYAQARGMSRPAFLALAAEHEMAGA